MITFTKTFQYQLAITQPRSNMLDWFIWNCLDSLQSTFSVETLELSFWQPLREQSHFFPWLRSSSGSWSCRAVWLPSRGRSGIVGSVRQDFQRYLYSEENQGYQAWLGPPGNEDGFVRGTRELAPGQCPRSKYEALFDNRPIFDAIREDFLKRADPESKLKRVRQILED